MRNKLVLFAGAAIVATLATVVTPGVGAAAETVSWSAQSAVPNAGTSATPAMTTCNGVTYMVWKGSGNDDDMYFSSSSSIGTWAPQQLLGGGGGTTTGPTVACDWNDDIVVAWRGIGGDQRIWYTMAQVENSVDQPTGTLRWSSQKIVDGGGLTDVSPSLAVLRNGGGNQLYLGWKGAGSDTSVHYATLTNAFAPWQVLGTVPGVSTVRSPTLTTGLTVPFGTPMLSLIWPLPGGQQIYYTNLSGGSWSGPAPFLGGSGAAPAGTEGPNDGYGAPDNLVAWQGSGSDTRIFYSVDQNQSGWQPQQLVANGGPTTNGLAAADNIQCPNGHCMLITAYLAWEGPQQQIEFVHGVY